MSRARGGFRSAVTVWLLALSIHCGQADIEKLTIAGGSLGGGWSVISEGIVSCMRRELPEVSINNEPGLDGANAVMVDSGRVQMGLVHSAMARLAVRGEYPYTSPLRNLRGISLVYSDSAFHFLVDRHTGLTSIEEIRRKKYPLRLSVIYRGSLMEIASRTVLEAYGISYEDIESWGGKVYFRALRPSLEMIREGRLDAISVTVQFPQTQINQTSLHQELRLLPLSDHAIDFVNQRLGTCRSRIPAAAYSFVDSDVPTFSDVVILIANSGMSRGHAYRVSRALSRNLSYLHNVHRALARLEPEHLPRVGALPLHPGALGYYREAGVLK